MSKLILKDADLCEQNPGFESRLNETFNRVHKILKQPKIAVFLTVFLGSIVGGYFGFRPEPKDAYNVMVSSFGSTLVGYIGLIMTVYWNIDSVYGRKWSLIFDKYYEINKMVKPDRYNLHFCNLFIDALYIGVWGDKALNKCIHQHLIDALNEKVCEDENENLRIKLYSDTLTKSDAINILRNYAHYLDKKSSTNNGSIPYKAAN